MASSQEILDQLLNNYQNPGAINNQIEQSIKDAYSPGIKSLIDEGNTLRAPAQTAYFDEFAKAGHTAGDASAASLLSGALTSANNAYSPYATNLGLRDYYNTNVNNMVGKAQGLFSSGLGALKDQYSMLYQREQDARAEALAQEQLKLQKEAARRAAAASSGSGSKWTGFPLTSVDVPDGKGGTTTVSSGQGGGDPLANVKTGGQLDYNKLIGAGWKQVGLTDGGMVTLRAPDGQTVRVESPLKGMKPETNIFTPLYNPLNPLAPFKF